MDDDLRIGIVTVFGGHAGRTADRPVAPVHHNHSSKPGQRGPDCPLPIFSAPGKQCAGEVMRPDGDESNVPGSLVHFSLNVSERGFS